MIFTYEAVNREGTLVSGEIEALNESDAIRLLNQRQLMATEVISVPENLRPSAGKRATKQDLLVSLHEMVTLLESGISVAETIESQSLANYPDDLARSYDVMAKEIRKGNSFSDALRTAELKLPEYVDYLAEAGELTGNLAQSLREGVEQFEYEQKLSQEFKTALTYPAVLVASGIGAVLLIFTFVVPKFLPMLERVDDLPLLSELVFGAGLLLNDYYYVFVAVLVLLVVAISSAAASPGIRQKVLDVLAGTPVVGAWIAETDTARWSSVMAALLVSRADLLNALELSARAVKGTRRRARLEMVNRDIRAGESLADSLEKAGVLTNTGYNLIRSGERSGKLPMMMKSVARLYDEGARNRMRRVLALIEPLAILLIGGFIGSIILGVILAITSVNDVNF